MTNTALANIPVYDDNDVDELDLPDLHIRKCIRSMLRPRAAQAILQAMETGFSMEKITFDANCPNHEKSGILVFNNIRYFALAQNRRLVRARLAEQIFRDLVIGEMRKIVTELFPNVDNPMMQEIDAETIFAQEDFPLNNVVSYAVYRLQETWAIDGYSLPDYRPKARKLKKVADAIPPCVPKRTRGYEDLPEHAADMNPTCLLAYMRPMAKYEELQVNPGSPLPWFMYNLTVDGRSFNAEATSKKMARRIAAAKACYAMFGVRYPELDDY